MPRLTSAARWLLPAIIALVWLGLAGPLGSLGGGLTEVQENDSAAFLPDSAESTRVTELQRGFQTSRALPVILLWEGDGHPRRAATGADRRPHRAGDDDRRRRPRRRGLPADPVGGRRGGPGGPPDRTGRRRRAPGARRRPARHRGRRRDDGLRHRPGRLVRRLRRRLLRHRRPAAARGVRRRPADPAGRLPQPDPAVPRHRHRRPGAHRLDGRRLPAGQGRAGSTSTARARASPRSWSWARPPTTACCWSPGTARNCARSSRSTPPCGSPSSSRGHPSSRAVRRSSSASSACCCPTSAPTAASARSPR